MLRPTKYDAAARKRGWAANVLAAGSLVVAVALFYVASNQLVVLALLAVVGLVVSWPQVMASSFTPRASQPSGTSAQPFFTAEQNARPVRKRSWFGRQQLAVIATAAIVYGIIRADLDWRSAVPVIDAAITVAAMALTPAGVLLAVHHRIRWMTQLAGGTRGASQRTANIVEGLALAAGTYGSKIELWSSPALRPECVLLGVTRDGTPNVLVTAGLDSLPRDAAEAALANTLAVAWRQRSSDRAVTWMQSPWLAVGMLTRPVLQLPSHRNTPVQMLQALFLCAVAATFAVPALVSWAATTWLAGQRQALGDADSIGLTRNPEGLAVALERSVGEWPHLPRQLRVHGALATSPRLLQRRLALLTTRRQTLHLE